MERRWSSRKPRELNARLCYRSRKGLPPQPCRTRDFGLSGAFLWTAAPPPNEETDLELVLTRSSGRVIRLYRFPARLVRVAAHGIGVMFQGYDAHTFRALQDILFRHTRPAAVLSELEER